MRVDEALSTKPTAASQGRMYSAFLAGRNDELVRKEADIERRRKRECPETGGNGKDQYGKSDHIKRSIVHEIVDVPYIEKWDDYIHEKSINILRGANGTYLLSWLSFAASVTMGIIGIATMTACDADESAEECETCRTQNVGMQTFAILYLIGSAMNLSRSLRDKDMGAVVDRHKEKSSTGGNDGLLTFISPPSFSHIQVFLHFIFSVVCSIASIFVVKIEDQWRGTIIMTFLWILFSTFALTKFIRDRDDAEKFDSLPHELHRTWGQSTADATTADILRYLILDLANGAWWFVGLNWISVVTSFFMTIIWMWVDKNYDKMADANKGMVTVCFMWLVCMCIGFAVLVRDYQDRYIRDGDGWKEDHDSTFVKKELGRRPAYQFIVILGFVASVVSTIVAVAIMEGLVHSQRVFLGTGAAYTCVSFLFLAKHSRDVVVSGVQWDRIGAVKEYVKVEKVTWGSGADHLRTEATRMISL